MTVPKGPRPKRTPSDEPRTDKRRSRHRHVRARARHFEHLHGQNDHGHDTETDLEIVEITDEEIANAANRSLNL